MRACPAGRASLKSEAAPEPVQRRSAVFGLEGTAKLHLYNVYKKLGVANRVELVIRMQGVRSAAS